jgi:hypothetical protein
MGTKRAITPLGAVAGGLLAAAAGTVAMDAYRWWQTRRAGRTETFLGWEFAPVESWDSAPAPGIVAKRVIEGFTQKPLPDRYAFAASTFMHWAYGAGNGAAYGVVVGSLQSAHPLDGLPYGAAVWLSGYVVLPLAGLYQPIWKYDVKTLANDLGGHLIYGATTGTVFWLVTKLA